MAKTRDPQVRRASAYRSERRMMRKPVHPYQLRSRPFAIQPFMMAPVLPGETLKNLVLQSRVVSKPLVHPLIGWWLEHYFFFVRLRDIEYHEQTNFVEQMVVNPTGYNAATIRTAITGGSTADPRYYFAAGGTNWLKSAVECITEYYFRDEGEDWNVATDDTMPLAQIANKNWMDSVTLNINKRTAAGRDPDLDANNDGDLTATELFEGLAHYNALRDAGLEAADYEDWIATFGVDIPEKNEASPNLFKPELIRYDREWAYPTNTVEPTTGAPSSAMSWVTALRADKDRYFKEPGFIVGITVQKPKVFIKDQIGGLANYMETLQNWLPALTHESYEKAFMSFAANAGPLNNKIPDGVGGYRAYWVDLRDLFMYGDQFLNFAPDGAANALTLFTSGGKYRYPSSADIDALFTGATAADRIIRHDGVVNLVIAGRQKDRTSGPVL